MFNIFLCKSSINKLLTKNIYELQNIIKYNDIWNENIQIYKYRNFHIIVFIFLLIIYHFKC